MISKSSQPAQGTCCPILGRGEASSLAGAYEAVLGKLTGPYHVLQEPFPIQRLTFHSLNGILFFFGGGGVGSSGEENLNFNTEPL